MTIIILMTVVFASSSFFILVVMVIAPSRRMVHARVVSGPLPSVHMNTAAMSEIEPGNVLQVSTSLSIFAQPPQVCVEQTSAAGWLREQALGGGRTLAASGWHVLACVRTRRSLARDDAALRATRDAAVRACARTGIACATQRCCLRAYGVLSRSNVRHAFRAIVTVRAVTAIERRRAVTAIVTACAVTIDHTARRHVRACVRVHAHTTAG